jgi:hypothetical protein
MSFYDKKRNFLYLISIFLSFLILTADYKKVKSENIFIEMSTTKIYHVQSRIEEYPLQTFTVNVLKTLKSFLNMKDFVKFTFSLPENQQKYLFRVYLSNYFQVYDENCELQHLNFQKLNFCSVCEAIGYDSKLLLSSKSFDIERIRMWATDKIYIVRFQINGEFIPLEQFYHTGKIFYHFNSNHFFAIRFEHNHFVTEMKFFGKVTKIEGETGNCFFNLGWFEITKFSIPSDLHVLGEPSLEQHRIIKNLTKFGQIVDKICFAQYCPNFLPILLFRLVTPMPLILLLLFLSSCQTQSKRMRGIGVTTRTNKIGKKFGQY